MHILFRQNPGISEVCNGFIHVWINQYHIWYICSISMGSSGWWFQIFFIFTPDPWGNDPNWRAYFSDGWEKNHQLVINTCSQKSHASHNTSIGRTSHLESNYLDLFLSVTFSGWGTMACFTIFLPTNLGENLFYIFPSKSNFIKFHQNQKLDDVILKQYGCWVPHTSENKGFIFPSFPCSGWNQDKNGKRMEKV